MALPPDRDVTDWKSLIDCYPIWQQRDIDQCVGWLEPQALAATPEPRVLAWLAYTCATAAQDWWATEDASWGSLQGFDPQQLLDAAKKLYIRAETLMTPGDVHGYDVHWSAGFVKLFLGRHSVAKSSFDTALGQKPALISLNVEVADVLGYRGEPGMALSIVQPAIEQLEKNSEEVPEWYWWVLAWAHVGLAAQPPLEGAESLGHAEDAVAALDRMTAQYPGGIPWDFDAAIIRLMANYVLNGASGAASQDTALWGHYLDVVRFHKGLDWSLRHEIERTPFDKNQPAAAWIDELMRAAIPAGPTTARVYRPAAGASSGVALDSA